MCSDINGTNTFFHQNLQLLLSVAVVEYNNALARVDAASANAFYSIIKCAHFNAFYFDDNKMRNLLF